MSLTIVEQRKKRGDKDTYNSKTKKMNVGVSNASWSSTEK